ncbi:MAG: hypothetical protein WC460_06765 [Patescibacteria group bacterium]
MNELRNLLESDGGLLFQIVGDVKQILLDSGIEFKINGLKKSNKQLPGMKMFGLKPWTHVIFSFKEKDQEIFSKISHVLLKIVKKYDMVRGGNRYWYVLEPGSINDAEVNMAAPTLKDPVIRIW